MASEREKLAWIQRNRSPRPERARSASTLVLEFARELGERQANVLQPLADCIAQIVDPQFRSLCRLLDLQNGLLRFTVADAGLAAIMRMKWTEPILQALTARRARPSFRVREVRFEFGTAGMAIPQFTDERTRKKR